MLFTILVAGLKITVSYFDSKTELLGSPSTQKYSVNQFDQATMLYLMHTTASHKLQQMNVKFIAPLSTDFKQKLIKDF